MGHERDAMMLVKAELCRGVEALKGLPPRGASREFTHRVGALRSLAAAYGLQPVVRLADALERSAGPSHQMGAKALYLARLEDAIGCDTLDERATEAMLASVSVRFSA